MLADNEISRAEYEEATQRFVDCMNDRGLSASRYEIYGSGVYGYSLGHEGGDDIMIACEAGTITIIEPLYLDALQDPERRGYEVMVTECLQRKGLLPDDYDPADFTEDVRAGFASYFDMANDAELAEVFGNCAMNPTM